MAAKLFAVYVGGAVKGCHVELHDVRFVIGETIEDCFGDLIAQWWGDPESLHLDAWGVLEAVDGYRVEIVDEPPPAASERLWFLNLGGYDSAQFTELHENVFVVASDWRAAKRKALERISGWESPHKDYVFEVETAIDVAAALTGGKHLRLAPGGSSTPFKFEARYVPFGRMASAESDD